MNFIKRAVIAVSRRKGKTIILFLLFLAIANFVLAGFAIRNATKEAEINARKQLGATITFSFDMQGAARRAFESAQNSESNNNGNSSIRDFRRIRFDALPITENMVETIKKQENIIGFTYFVNSMAQAEGFEAVDTSAEEDTSSGSASGSTNNSAAGSNSGITTGSTSSSASDSASDNSSSAASDNASDNSSSAASNNSGSDGNSIPNNNQEGRLENRLGRFLGGDFEMPDISVTGVSSTDILDEFDKQTNTLVEGRHINSSDAGKKVALIEKTLADQNSLKTGSKISLKSVRSDDLIEYTVVGIYTTDSTNASTDPGRFDNMLFMQPFNKIYVDYSSALPLKNVKQDDESVTKGGIDSAMFFVDDPANVDKAVADIKKMNIDWNTYTVDADNSTYDRMVGPIESVAGISVFVIYFVAIAGIIILALILMLSMKERIYETGVLMSLGEGRLKIIMQYVSEVLIIAIIAFGLSYFTGRIIAQNAGTMLLDAQVQSYENRQQAGFGDFRSGGGGRLGMMFRQNFRFGATGNIETIKTMDVGVSANEMANMAGLGLIIIVLGTILPASTIMRYKPKTILTKAI